MEKMQENLTENRMGTMPINKLLLSMSVPMMVSMLVQALYNVVDSIFVAQIGEQALTAVSLAFPLQSFMISVTIGTGVGVNALLSKSLGEKNHKMANKAANMSIFLAVASWVVFLVIGIFGTDGYFRSQIGNEDIIAMGNQYLSICCICSLAMYGQVTFEKLLQSTGQTFYTMISQTTGAVVNIILDPILIFGWLGFPKMGVAGAAIATVFGQLCGCLLSFYFNQRKNPEIRLAVGEMVKPDWMVIKSIYAVGIPSIVMASIGSVMTFAMNKILMGFEDITKGIGETATAVFGVYFKLQSFVMMPVFGLNNGMVPIVAFNYGAKNRERIFQTIKLSITYAVCMLLVGVAVFELIPDKLLLLFNASDNMLAIGVPALRIICLCFIFAGFAIVMLSVFQALGHGVYSLMVSVARQLFVLIPAAYLLSLTGKVELVWWAFPIAEFVAVGGACIFFRKIVKELG